MDKKDQKTASFPVFSETHQNLQVSNQQLEASNRKLRISQQRLQYVNRLLQIRNKQLLSANKELQEKEKQAQQYLDIANIIFIAMDSWGKVSMINKKGCELLGYGQEKEIIGRDWFHEFIPAKVRDEVKSVFKDLMKGEETLPEYFENSVLTRQGEERMIAWHNTLLRNEQEHIIGILSSGEDITEKTQTEQSLKESEAQLRELIQNLPVMMDALDDHLNVLFWNKECEQVTGYSAQEIVENPRAFEILYQGDEYQKHVVPLFELMKKPYRNRQGLTTCKDGSKRVIAWSNISLHLKSPQPASWAIGIDITEQKKAEDMLRLNEARLEALLEMNRMTHRPIQEITDFALEQAVRLTRSKFGCLAFLNSDETVGNFECWSRRASNDYRTTDKCLIEEMELWQETVRQRKPIINNAYPSAETPEKKPLSMDARLKRHMNIPIFEGSHIIAVASVANKEEDYDESDVRQLTLLMQGLWQLMQRKKNEDALRRSNETLNAIIDSAPLPIFSLDVQGRIQHIWNPAAEQLLGWEKSEVMGHYLPSVSEERRKEYFEIIKRICTNKQNEGIDVKRIRRDGSPIEYTVYGSALHDNQGQVSGILFILLDITQRKQVEKKLFDYQKELRSLAAQLSLVEEKERRHIATQLHDQIGQNLVFAKLNLQSLYDNFPAGEKAQLLKKITSMIDTAIQDTRSLTFDLSSPILYELGLEPALSELFHERFQEHKGITTEFVASEGIGPLEKDVQILLYQAVRELLVNILKHAHAGHVKLSIQREMEQIRISVQDDGVGFMPDEDLYRVAKTGGFGLFNIRERLGYISGQCKIESEPEKGTRVTLLVPLQQKKRKINVDKNHFSG